MLIMEPEWLSKPFPASAARKVWKVDDAEHELEPILQPEEPSLEDDEYLNSWRSPKKKYPSEYFFQMRAVHPPQDRSEEQRDLKLAHGDDAEAKAKATQRIISHNIGLTFAPAILYARPYAGLEVDHLIAFGMLELTNCIRDYDLDRGTLFSVFARKPVRNRIRFESSAYQTSLIHYPEEVLRDIRRLERARAELYQLTGEQPSIYKMAEKVGWPMDRVRDLLASLSVVKLLDTAQKDIDSILPTISTSDCTAMAETNDIVKSLLKDLTDTERHVLMLHHAPLGGPPLTLEEIGNAMGFSKERAWQVEHGALKKLRSTEIVTLLRNLRQAQNAKHTSAQPEAQS